MRGTQIIIDRHALSHNLRQVRQRCPSSHIMAMVKADAYGHGIDHCLPALQDADALGVCCLEEALTLRRLGWHKPIGLIEGVFSLEEWQQARIHNLSCIIHHPEQLAWACEHPNITHPIWLKVNTGMNRLGFTPEHAVKAAKRLYQAGYQLILTHHYANADQADHCLNTFQQQQFDSVVQAIQPQQTSSCNSAALLNWHSQHGDWVRPGIMLYGSSPITTQSAQSLSLKPVMTLQGKIISKYDIPAQAVVGYGSVWQTDTVRTLAVIGCGYGDGYPRVINPNTPVLIQGQHVPIVGRISMDMLTVDITDIAATVHLGTTVELWGKQLSIDTIAACANTISYELMCKVTARPRRLIRN